ncbi:hypothetical protein [Streptomyces sp. Amel2xC10]|uniref:hypothetical protein n=1 Tax=Streptomyces sp. Amel2xC10 TaxID=1305826 RepID=UPI00117F3E81|nr:hypothetical protein [Streptomyces sp. Amel2xC10]
MRECRVLRLYAWYIAVVSGSAAMKKNPCVKIYTFMYFGNVYTHRMAQEMLEVKKERRSIGGMTLPLIDLGAAIVMAVFCVLFLMQNDRWLTISFGVASLGALFTAWFRNRKRAGQNSSDVNPR